MAKQGTFTDGFIEGWRSVLGQGAALPGIPSYAIPTGKAEYEHGYDEGRKAAADRHPSGDKNSN